MRTQALLWTAVLCLGTLLGCGPAPAGLPASGSDPPPGTEVSLPPPDRSGRATLARVLAGRRSWRDYGRDFVTLEQLGQLLWAAAGSVDAVTAATRTAPSAGATHPVEIYVVAGESDEMAAGVYHYDRVGHRLVPLLDRDVRAELAAAALNQAFVARAPVTIVIAADFARTTTRYGERGQRYVLMEAGHVAQNLCLAAEALDLGTVVVGAFDDARVQAVLGVPHPVLVLLPVGSRP